jgi:hypothetical protein
MSAREKCCNQEIVKPRCKVGIPPVEMGIQAYVKKLWTGKIMINFSNTINKISTPVYGYVDMKGIVMKDKRSVYLLDECIEREADKIKDINMRFMKILELGISPYCRYNNIPYTQNIYPSTVADRSFWENIPDDIQAVLTVKYAPYENDGLEGHVSDTGMHESEGHIPITKFNNMFLISEVIEGITMPARTVLLTIKTYVSLANFIANIKASLSQAFIVPRVPGYTPSPLNIDVETYSNTATRFKLKFTSIYNSIIEIPVGFKTFGLAPGFYKLDKGVYITPSVNYIYVTEMVLYRFKVATVLHEFLHFLGMVHTHQAAENNPIIHWDREKIRKDTSYTDAIIDSQFTDRNQDFQELPQPFDRLSIMTYDIKGCWNRENISTKDNYKLSDQDKDGLRTNYGPASKPVGYNPCPILPTIIPGNSLEILRQNKPSTSFDFFKDNIIYFLIILVSILAIILTINK